MLKYIKKLLELFSFNVIPYEINIQKYEYLRFYIRCKINNKLCTINVYPNVIVFCSDIGTAIEIPLDTDTDKSEVSILCENIYSAGKDYANNLIMSLV